MHIVCRVFYDVGHTLVAKDMLVSYKSTSVSREIKVAPRISLFVLDRLYISVEDFFVFGMKYRWSIFYCRR